MLHPGVQGCQGFLAAIQSGLPAQHMPIKHLQFFLGLASGAGAPVMMPKGKNPFFYLFFLQFFADRIKTAF